VLDIGCGMALYDYFLFKHYNFDKRMELYLLDKSTNELENKESFIGGGWHADGKFSFYTSLECAAEILTENTGLSENIFAIVAKDGTLDVYEDGSFDVVYSLLSYGHHYPVSTYLDDVFRLLKSGGVLILDLRATGYGRRAIVQGLVELLSKGFSCTIVRHRRRGKTVKCFKA